MKRRKAPIKETQSCTEKVVSHGCLPAPVVNGALICVSDANAAVGWEIILGALTEDREGADCDNAEAEKSKSSNKMCYLEMKLWLPDHLNQSPDWLKVVKIHAGCGGGEAVEKRGRTAVFLNKTQYDSAFHELKYVSFQIATFKKKKNKWN